MPYPEQQFADRIKSPTSPIGAHNSPRYRPDLGEGRVSFPWIEARSVDLSKGDRLVDLFTLPAGTWILLHGHRITDPVADNGTIDLLDAFASVQATGTAAFGDVGTAADTITINGQVYTFVATPSEAYDVKIGATAAETAGNLIAAINGGSGAGTKYGLLTPTNGDVKASLVSTATVYLTALGYGITGNAVTLAKSSSAITLSDTELADGSDGTVIVNDIDCDTAGITYDGGVRTVNTQVAIVLTDPLRLKARVVGSGDAPAGLCTFFYLIIDPSQWDGLALEV